MSLIESSAASTERFVRSATSSTYPCLDDFAGALIAIADDLDGDPDIEPEDDLDVEEEAFLNVFGAQAGFLRRRPVLPRKADCWRKYLRIFG
ncbi:MAG TPA: hypothetical protein VIF34_07365 [Methylocystis sp.]|jgi:hypothetical protein